MKMRTHTDTHTHMHTHTDTISRKLGLKISKNFSLENFWPYCMKFLIEVVDLVTKCVINAKAGKGDTVLSVHFIV